MHRTGWQTRWYWILGGAGLAVLIPLYFFYDPNGGGFPACPFHSLTGLFCTGCGSQRAFHDLLHLDFAGALGHNLLLLPALFLLGWHGASLLGRSRGLKNWTSPLDRTRTPRFLLYVLLAFTLLRNLPWEPFRQLAP